MIILKYLSEIGDLRNYILRFKKLIKYYKLIVYLK